MNNYYIDYTFLASIINDKIINEFNYPLDYDIISNYILTLTYGEKRVIDLVKKGEDYFISPTSKETIDNLIEIFETLNEENKDFYSLAFEDKDVSEEEKEAFHEEVLKMEQLINVLQTMKNKEFAPPKLGEYVFAALPVDDGCSLEESVYNDNNDVQSAISNLETMEGLVEASMNFRGMIQTKQHGSGLHKAGKHVMYKNTGNNQRILFKQCKDNPNVFFVLVINCGAHANKLDDDRREEQYDRLTGSLETYLGTLSVDGKVVLTKKKLTELSKLYENYKFSLANKFVRGKDNSTINALKKLAKKISNKAKEMKVGDKHE